MTWSYKSTLYVPFEFVIEFEIYSKNCNSLNATHLYSKSKNQIQSQTQKTTSQQSFKSSGVFQQTPLSPVPECATNAPTQGSAPIKLALAPKNRDEMMLRRLESQATTPNGLPRTVIGQFDFPAKPPPRHNHSVSTTARFIRFMFTFSNFERYIISK